MNLQLAGAPISNEELVIKILSGLGLEYREISAAIRARDTPITYEELFDKLSGHETFLKHEEQKNVATPITAQVNQRTTPQNNNQSFGPKLSRKWNGQNQQRRQSRMPFNSLHSNKNFTNNYGFSLSPWRPPPNSKPQIQCQLCGKFEHVVNVCRSKSHNYFEAKAHYATRTMTNTNPWILDTGASHHITVDPQTLVKPHDISMGNDYKTPITQT